MVEFAISVPVILLLMFGTFEFGRLITEYSALNDGVRDAARYVAGAALNGTDGTMITGAQWTTLYQQGQNVAVYGNAAGTGNPIFPGLVVGDITLAEDTTLDTITVNAAYPYTSLFGGVSIPTFMGGSIATNYTLRISTTMRAL
jgi:Flp pilus assembly protein TadG